jgi:hypothetical protein
VCIALRRCRPADRTLLRLVIRGQIIDFRADPAFWQIGARSLIRGEYLRTKLKIHLEVSTQHEHRSLLPSPLKVQRASTSVKLKCSVNKGKTRPFAAVKERAGREEKRRAATRASRQPPPPPAFTYNLVPANQRRRLHTLLHTVLRFTVFSPPAGYYFLPCALSLCPRTLLFCRVATLPFSLLSPAPKDKQRRRSRLLVAWSAAESSAWHWTLALSRRFTREERVTTLRY